MAAGLPEGFSGFGTTPFKGERPGRSGEIRVRFPPKRDRTAGRPLYGASKWMNFHTAPASAPVTWATENKFLNWQRIPGPHFFVGDGGFSPWRSNKKIRFGKTWKHLKTSFSQRLIDVFVSDWKRRGIFEAILFEVRRVINGRRLCTFLGRQPGKMRLVSNSS